MFKKIEIWILYLVILVSILFAIGFGILVRQELVGSIKAGWASKTALFLSEIPVYLKAFGSDLTLEDRFPSLEGFNGIPNSQESYLLLSRYDGNLKEGVVELIDLRNFKILHTWNPDINAFNNLVKKDDEFKYLNRDNDNSRSILRHPLLDKDGNLFFKRTSQFIKINSCSNLIFQNTHDLFHHSVEIDHEGNIWVPSHMYPQSLQSKKVGRNIPNAANKSLFGKGGGYKDDAIVKLSPNGEILFEKSVSQIFVENGLEYLLFSLGGRYFNNDPIHLNDIQPVLSDREFWKKGDLFLSLRHQSMILLYRPSTNKIIWKGVGPFFHQHDIDILDQNRISIFNNNSKEFINGDIVDGYNDVIIYDFKKNVYSSYLSGSLREHNVRTVTEGISQILQNGDLFIEETNYARTLYFNKDGSLRWTHLNRGDDGNVYMVSWSRILYSKEDINIVNQFLKTMETCNE